MEREETWEQPQSLFIRQHIIGVIKVPTAKDFGCITFETN